MPKFHALRPVSTSANLVARTGTVACSSIEKKQSDWFSLILVAKKLNLIQLPELTARSPVNAGFQLGFRAAHALIAHRLVARPNSPKWKPALMAVHAHLKTTKKREQRKIRNNISFAYLPRVSKGLA